MSDEATPRLSIPYLAAAQAQKHVTLNEGLSRLDGLVQTAVESRATDAQPASPADGALYIMTAAATGADWAGKAAGTVMRFEAGAWGEFPVAEGHIAYVADEGVLVFFDGAAWADFSGLIDVLQGLSLLGVNTTADATNKLSVASPAVLFNHAGAGSQVKVNKAAAGDTASHLFQTGFSGRAEFGLTGSDDFTVKVSPNGASWNTALTVNRNTGLPTLPLGMAVGAGIAFPAAQVASADPNTLDDYEEGTWTPGIQMSFSSNADITYASRAGRYTKVGRAVHVTGNLTLSSKGVSTGIPTITGLPFTSGAGLSVTLYMGGLTGTNNAPIGTLESGQTRVGIYSRNTAGNAVPLTEASFTNSTSLNFGTTYSV